MSESSENRYEVKGNVTIWKGDKKIFDILASKSKLMKQMVLHRMSNTMQLYRICTIQEAMATYMYCVAGGQPRVLEKPTCSEMEAVKQVANNEGAPWAKRSVTALKDRRVVEYAEKPTQLKLQGTMIIVWINKKYLVQGSGLEFEGFGWLALIGAPLAGVAVKTSDFNHAYMPLPPTPDDTELPGVTF